MPVRIVQSKHNTRLKELRRVMSRPEKSDGGLVGIEGPNLLEEALRAGLRICCVFAAEESQHLLGSLEIAPETELLLLPRSILASALSTETPQPLAALIEPPAWSWPQLLSPGSGPWLLVILAGVQDPGNLGTILRSAEAFGASGVIGLPGTVSAWNQKAIRASAGSVFRLPFLTSGIEDCFARLDRGGFDICTTALHGGTPIGKLDLDRPVAFMIGNEGNGVPSEIAARASRSVTIPCPGPVESLNASVAAGILLYEAARQRASHLHSTKGTQ